MPKTDLSIPRKGDIRVTTYNQVTGRFRTTLAHYSSIGVTRWDGDTFVISMHSDRGADQLVEASIRITNAQASALVAQLGGSNE